MHRFYISPESWSSDALVLTGNDAHHARNVLRLPVGAEIIVFNGRGNEATAEIISLSRTRLELRRKSDKQTPALRSRICLAQAIPKGSQMDWIIRKAVELGAAEIAPLISERTVVALRHEGETDSKQRKWEQVAIEAAKQCGQNWLPRIRTAMSFPECLDDLTPFDLRLIGSLQSNAVPLREVVARLRHDQDRPGAVQLFIGPEGDFSAAELTLAQEYNCLPVSFGPLTLRVETAALFGLSVLANELLA